ncbi:MAG: diguanylate cyclase [Trueperaceae bacterium]|nr:diguanylate cyclase [Trueperaceae bacterium]
MTLALELALFHTLVAAGVAFLVGVLVGRRQARARPWLVGSLVAAFLYAAGFALELAGDDVAWVLATFRVQHLGVAFVPSLVLLVAFEFARPAWARSRAVQGVLLGVSAATYLAVVTNPWHGLYHVAPRMDASGPFPMIAFDRGPWYVAFHLYVAAALLAANAVFVQAWRVARGQARARAQLLAAASLLPWAGSGLYLAGLSPWGLDTTPAFLAGSVALLYVGIVRMGLADVLPVARELVVEHLSDPVVVVDPTGTSLDRNPAAVALRSVLGAAGESALLAEPDGAAPGEAPVGAWRREVAGRTFDVRAVALSDRRGVPLGRAIVVHDVSQAARLEASLRELATTDGLTGLANRRHLLELAERDVARARRSGRPFAVAIFDIDRFKVVNDRHGHHAGDDVLRAVAACALANARASDAVARYGGEEFAITLPDVGEDEAAAAGERVRVALAALRVPVAGAEVQVTVSLGVAVGSRPSSSRSGPLRRADAAQYRAKLAGGDAVVVDRGEAA